MEVRLEKNGPRVASARQTLDSFAFETQDRQAQWEHRLIQDPGGFREVQLEIQQHFREGAELPEKARNWSMCAANGSWKKCIRVPHWHRGISWPGPFTTNWRTAESPVFTWTRANSNRNF